MFYITENTFYYCYWRDVTRLCNVSEQWSAISNEVNILDESRGKPQTIQL